MKRLLITKRLKITKGVKSSRNPYEEKMRGGGDENMCSGKVISNY
jgi:hypothetical protein